MSNLFTSNSLGFSMQSQPVLDVICVSETQNQKFCSENGLFLQIVTLQQNYWNYESDLQAIGGVLGLGLDPCQRICTSMWQGDHVNQVQRMTLALGAERDYDWWFEARNLNKSDYAN